MLTLDPWQRVFLIFHPWIRQVFPSSPVPSSRGRHKLPWASLWKTSVFELCMFSPSPDSFSNLLFLFQSAKGVCWGDTGSSPWKYGRRRLKVSLTTVHWLNPYVKYPIFQSWAPPTTLTPASALLVLCIPAAGACHCSSETYQFPAFLFASFST